MEKPVRPTKPKFKKPVYPKQHSTVIKLIVKDDTEYKLVSFEDVKAHNFDYEFLDNIDVSILPLLPYSATCSLSEIKLFIFDMGYDDSTGYFAVEFPTNLTDEEFTQAMDEYNKILKQQEYEMLQYKIDLAEYGKERALYDFETARIAYDNTLKE